MIFAFVILIQGMINVALVGAGYWGPNLARSFFQLKETNLSFCCDLYKSKVEKIGSLFPSVKVTQDFYQLLKDPKIDAIAIATPAKTHFSLAQKSLLAGKHVLVEKPLALKVSDCEALTKLAKKRELVLMVDHIFLYNKAAEKIKDYLKKKTLGDLYYIFSNRLNLGIVRDDVNALWNFAPHDFSLLLYFLKEEPLRIIATGQSFLQKGIQDIVFVHLEFPKKVIAQVQVSWLNPVKERKMIVVGNEKMAIWDDVDPDNKIKLYDSTLAKTRRADKTVTLGKFETYSEFQFLKRAGDILIPKIDFSEPLADLCKHFADCITKRKKPITDGIHATKVVKMLVAAQESLDKDGMPVELK